MTQRRGPMSRLDDPTDLDSRIDAGPGGGGGSSGGRSPLGVTDDYEAPHTPVQDTGTQYRIGDTIPQKPRYFEGDEWKPAAMSPEGIAYEQRRLLNAGFLSPTDGIRLGFWDDATRKAYKEALSAANASGLDYDHLLIQASKAVPVGGSGSQ